MAFADSAAEYELSDDQFSTSELVTHKHRKINRRHTSYINAFIVSIALCVVHLSQTWHQTVTLIHAAT